MAYEITVNPDIQNKLIAEIEAMESKLDGKTISYDQIQGLKYMDQVVCETLRKWPPSPVRIYLIALKVLSLTFVSRWSIVSASRITSWSSRMAAKLKLRKELA